MLAAAPAAAAPQGELDESFGQHGRLLDPLRHGAGDHSVGWAIAQSPADGKILVAGHALAPDLAFAFMVVRLNPDGSPDPAFGTNGAAKIDFDVSEDIATALAVLPDGRILVAGHRASFSEQAGWDQDLALARLNPDGSPDATFGTGGLVTRNLGGRGDSAAGIVLLGDGKFVVAGTTDAGGTLDVVFARFEANGSPDTTFGTSAIAGATVVDAGGGQDQAFAMTQQADGKLVACGLSVPDLSSWNGSAMLAVRLNPDGTPDRGFGAGGAALAGTATAISSAQGCVAMPDGSIVLAGFGGDAGAEDVMLARLAPDGRLDPGFAQDGIARIDLGGSESARSIVRLSDGGLAVAGLTAVLVNTVYPQGFPNWHITAPQRIPSEMFLARIDADSGMLDAEFGNDGVTIVDFGEGDQASWAYGQALIQQADGMLVAAGSALRFDEGFPHFAFEYPSMALARVDPAGSGSRGLAGFHFGPGYPGTHDPRRPAEPGSEVVVVVRRTGGSTGALAVDYETVADTALASRDFTAASGTLTWMNGETGPKFISVPVHAGASGRFVVRLDNSTGGLAGSELRVLIDSPPPPRPPPPPGDDGDGHGGGGSAGIAWLLLLPLLRRRRH